MAADPQLLDLLREIHSLAHSAVTQRAPSDDAIIAEHIQTVRDLAKVAIKLAEAA